MSVRTAPAASIRAIDEAERILYPNGFSVLEVIQDGQAVRLVLDREELQDLAYSGMALLGETP